MFISFTEEMEKMVTNEALQQEILQHHIGETTKYTCIIYCDCIGTHFVYIGILHPLLYRFVQSPSFLTEGSSFLSTCKGSEGVVCGVLERCATERRR